MRYQVEFNTKAGQRKVIITDNITKFYQELDGKTVIRVKRI